MDGFCLFIFNLCGGYGFDYLSGVFLHTGAEKDEVLYYGCFFLSLTLGNVFTAVVNIFIRNEDGTSKLPGASYFWFFAIAMALTAAIFVFVAKVTMKRPTSTVKPNLWINSARAKMPSTGLQVKSGCDGHFVACWKC